MKVSVLPWPKFDPWPIPSKWKAHQKEWYSVLICITSKSIGQNGSNPFKKKTCLSNFIKIQWADLHHHPET